MTSHWPYTSVFCLICFLLNLTKLNVSAGNLAKAIIYFSRSYKLNLLPVLSERSYKMWELVFLSFKIVWKQNIIQNWVQKIPLLLSCKETCASYTHNITELLRLRLEKISKIINFNCLTNAFVVITKLCPQLPEPHVFWTHPAIVIPPVPRTFCSKFEQKYFLISNLDFLWCNLKLLFLIVSLYYLGEEVDLHLATTSFQVAVESSKVLLVPSFLQAQQSQVLQLLLMLPGEELLASSGIIQ